MCAVDLSLDSPGEVGAGPQVLYMARPLHAHQMRFSERFMSHFATNAKCTYEIKCNVCQF
jgi:hypothetical protein